MGRKLNFCRFRCCLDHGKSQGKTFGSGMFSIDAVFRVPARTLHLKGRRASASSTSRKLAFLRNSISEAEYTALPGSVEYAPTPAIVQSLAIALPLHLEPVYPCSNYSGELPFL